MKNNKVLVFVISFAVNLLLAQRFKIKITFQEILTIHGFLFSLTFLAGLIQTKFSKHKNTPSSYLLSINFLRILVCVIFLLPIILKYEKYENTYIYNFFICYFIYLFCDLVLKNKTSLK